MTSMAVRMKSSSISQSVQGSPHSVILQSEYLCSKSAEICKCVTCTMVSACRIFYYNICYMHKKWLQCMACIYTQPKTSLWVRGSPSKVMYWCSMVQPYTHVYMHSFTLSSTSAGWWSDWAAASFSPSLISVCASVPCPVSTALSTDSQERCLLPVPGGPRSQSVNRAVQQSSFLLCSPSITSRRSGDIPSWRPM